MILINVVSNLKLAYVTSISVGFCFFLFFDRDQIGESLIFTPKKSLTTQANLKPARSSLKGKVSAREFDVSSKPKNVCLSKNKKMFSSV